MNIKNNFQRSCAVGGEIIFYFKTFLYWINVLEPSNTDFGDTKAIKCENVKNSAKEASMQNFFRKTVILLHKQKVSLSFFTDGLL